jgi:GntR family transcriptional regulator
MYWSLDPDSSLALHAQIAGSVRRAIASGDLSEGDRLPPAAELGEALGVDRNTVLAAYRGLRDEGVLEFRRGRGVRVASGSVATADLGEAIRALVALGESHGYQRKELIRLMEELA